MHKVKRWFRDPDKKAKLIYPVVVGVTIPLILEACSTLRQIREDKKSKFDVSAEMMMPIPFHTHDNAANPVVIENGDSNATNSDNDNDDIANVAVDSSLDMYAVGQVDGEAISIYATGVGELEYVPTVRLSVTNRNDFTIDIKEITVEVLNYKSPDEFTIESPAGGADERPVQQWRCDISNVEQEYPAKYIGTVNAENSDTDKNYVCVEAGDTGEFNVAMCSDIAGLYSVEVNIKYNFKGEVKTETTDEMKFIISSDKG